MGFQPMVVREMEYVENAIQLKRRVFPCGMGFQPMDVGAENRARIACGKATSVRADNRFVS
jgi:hypothetical protein